MEIETILIKYIEDKYEGNDKSKITIEEKARKIKEKIFSTTQLRLLLSNAVVIKNKIEIENKKNKNKILSETLRNEIKYLLIKHIYQCGRDSKVKEFDKKFEISKRIKNIGNSAENFKKFYRYLEEIVAYVKYYVG